MTDNINSLLERWATTKSQFDLHKELELQLRNELLKNVFDWDENQLEKGTKNYQIFNRVFLKATFKVKKSYEEEALNEALNELCQNENYLNWIAKLVKIKRVISLNYKVLEDPNLPVEIKTRIESILCEKQSQPELKIDIKEEK